MRGVQDPSWGSAVDALVDEAVTATRTALGAVTFHALEVEGSGLSVAELCSPGPAVRDGPDTASLTPREYEVARWVAQGLTNRMIAERLVLSIRTVDGHLERILAKLDFRSRAQVAAWVSTREQRSGAEDGEPRQG